VAKKKWGVFKQPVCAPYLRHQLQQEIASDLLPAPDSGSSSLECVSGECPFSLTGEHFAEYGSDLIRIIIHAPHKTWLETVASGNGLLIPVRQDQNGAEFLQQPFHLLYIDEIATGSSDQNDDHRSHKRVPESAGQISHCVDYFCFRDSPRYGFSYVITDPISCKQEYLHDL
jgi:hypothetical protein